MIFVAKLLLQLKGTIDAIIQVVRNFQSHRSTGLATKSIYLTDSFDFWIHIKDREYLGPHVLIFLPRALRRHAPTDFSCRKVLPSGSQKWKLGCVLLSIFFCCPITFSSTKCAAPQWYQPFKILCGTRGLG